MLSVPSQVKIFLCAEATDMRKGFDTLAGGNSQADQTWTIQDTLGNTLATATINIDELVGLTLDHFNPDPVPNAGGIAMHVEAVGSVSNPNQLDDPLSFAWTVVDIGGNPVGITDEGDHIVFGANPHGKYTVDLTVSDNYGNSQQGELSVDFSGGSNNPYNSDPNNDPNNSDPNNPNNNNPNNGDPNGDDPLPQDPDPQPDPPPAPPVDPNPVDPQPDPGSTDPGSSGPPTDQPPVQPPVDPPVVQHFGPSNIEIDGDTTVAPNSTASFSINYTPGDRGGEEVVWWVYDYQGNQIADGEGQNITFATGEDGSYNVNALVINQDGEDQTAIDTTSNGPTNLQLTPSVQTPAVGQPVTVSATFDDVNKNSNGGVEGYSYNWTVVDSKGTPVFFDASQDKLTFYPVTANETYTVKLELTDRNDQTIDQSIDVTSALPKVSISDVSQNEGDTGATKFNFLVTLDNPAARDVTVKVSTLDQTATAADNDYVPLTDFPVTIKAGDTMATVPVTVNGDRKYEANEFFYASLSDFTNTDYDKTHGIGTIVNDDVEVNSPGDQSSVEGATINLPITYLGQLNGKTFAATGLPKGLAINAATGVISGKIAYDAWDSAPGGAYTTTVSINDAAGVASSVTFNWQTLNATIDEVVAKETHGDIDTSNQVTTTGTAGDDIYVSPDNGVGLTAISNSNYPGNMADIKWSTGTSSGDFSSRPMFTPNPGDVYTVSVGIDTNQNGVLDASEVTQTIEIDGIKLEGTQFKSERTAIDDGNPTAIETSYFTINANDHFDVGSTFSYQMSAAGAALFGNPSLLHWQLWDADGIDDLLDSGKGLDFSHLLTDNDVGDVYIRFFADADDDGKCDWGESYVDSATFWVMEPKVYSYNVLWSAALSSDPTPTIATQLAYGEGIVLADNSPSDFRAAVRFQLGASTSFTPSAAMPDPVVDSQTIFANAPNNTIIVVSSYTIISGGVTYQVDGEAEWFGNLFWDYDELIYNMTSPPPDVLAHEIGHLAGLQHYYDSAHSFYIMADGGIRDPGANLLSATDASEYDDGP